MSKTNSASTLRIFSVAYSCTYSSAVFQCERDVMGDGSVWVPIEVTYLLAGVGYDVDTAECFNDDGVEVMLFAADVAHIRAEFIEGWHKVAA